ncbi:MAG: mandelate racemase [Limnochordales bacterium]|nr:mandelate racemase [Limnochordales bacterium]
MTIHIAAIEAIPLRLPFRREFRISRGTVGSPAAGAPHVLVRIVTDTGVVGWGEARPSPRWSYETLESVTTSVERYLSPALVGVNPFDLVEIHRRMEAELAPAPTAGQPLAKAAIDMAVHDIIGKVLGVPLYQLWGVAAAGPVPLSYLVTAGGAEEAREQVRAGLELGYRGFKVKLGIHPEEDLAIVAAVRETAPQSFIWVDCNQSYTLPAARRLARALAELSVDLLEQPVPAGDYQALQRLAQDGWVPLAVDESVFSPTDMINVVRAQAADCVVLKVTKLGGLWPARQVAFVARAAGLGLLGSGLTESRLGLAAAAHLLVACGVSSPADLNGPQFLADDVVASGVEVAAGQVRLSGLPGLGVEIDQEKVERYRIRLEI